MNYLLNHEAHEEARRRIVSVVICVNLRPNL